MDFDFRAPRTLSEWRTFALSVIALYVAAVLVASGEQLFAVWTGVYAGTICVAVAAIAVFAVRGARETLARSRERER